MNRSRQFLVDDGGPTSTEYAVMLALIIMVCLTAITLLGQKINGVFTKAGNVVPSVVT
jgi:pilus assembly protein Flp/PilA